MDCVGMQEKIETIVEFMDLCFANNAETISIESDIEAWSILWLVIWDQGYINLNAQLSAYVPETPHCARRRDQLRMRKPKWRRPSKHIVATPCCDHGECGCHASTPISHETI